MRLRHIILCLTPMRIASWNINGIKARLETVKDWLNETRPDIALFQEIKSIDDNFPREAFEEIGYQVETHGQKSFNGVAILSLHPLKDVVRRLPGDEDDEQARYMEATVKTGHGDVRFATLYLPNGNPVDDGPKFPYKLAWMDRLSARMDDLLKQEIPMVWAGDYNVIPSDDDVHDPAAWQGDALFRPESHAKYRTFLNKGLTDAFRACHNLPNRYTFWDYQAGAWQKDNGIRIDHFLLSPQLADRLEACEIDRFMRGRDKPSDHVPIWIEIN